MDVPREGRGIRAVPGHASACAVAGFLLAFLPTPCRSQIKPIELEGLIVTGTPVARTVGTEATHVTILDGEELRARGVIRVADALAEVPGLVTIQNGSYGSVTATFFRGAESDQVKVLVDGIEVNQAGGAYDFSGLLLSGIERIEVARGPHSALYGSDAVAGVINVITRRGQGAPGGSVAARTGSYGRREWEADLHGGSASSSYSLSASQFSSDGILQVNNQSRSTSFSGSFLTSPDEKTVLSLSGRYGDRVYHYPTDGTGNVVDQNAFTFGDEVALGLEGRRLVFRGVELRGRVRRYAWDGGSDDQPDGPEDNVGFFGYTSRDKFNRTSFDLRTDVALPQGSLLTAGVELEGETQRSSSETLSEYGPSSSSGRYDRSNQGYYAHLVWEGSTWSGNVGVRLEDNDQFGRFFTYQAGLSVRLPSRGTRVKGSLGRGLKEPTFLESYGTGFAVGNPDLRPEQSRVWDVGIEQRFGESEAVVSLTWFDQELRDLIQYTFLTSEPGGPNYFNVAEARSRGLEATARVPVGYLLLTGGYTYMATEVLDSGFDDGEGAVFVEGEALIRRPGHQWTLGAVYRTPRGRLFGTARWVGARSDRDFSAWPAEPVELPAFLLLGVGGELPVVEPRGGKPGFDLQLRIENLLDHGYQEVFGFRAPGRAILFGGRLRMGGGA